MEALVEKFYIESVLGSGAKVDDPASLVDGCIRKAYDDMMRGGRFFGIGGKDDRCADVRACLEDAGFEYSLGLIDKVACGFAADDLGAASGSRYATAFGLSQKIVNMAFKYLYCVKGHLGFDIDFAQCGCPVDSVVLGSLPDTHTAWTKLEKDEYLEVQGEINDEADRLVGRGDSDLPEDMSKGLFYDFMLW